MKFYDEQHKANYENLLGRMRRTDDYHLPLAYLFSLNSDCLKHINDLFDFDEDTIKPNGLKKEWQTGTSKQFTRLAFNLWNGYCYESETMEVDKNFCIDNIFCCSYAEYFFEAIRLRYPVYFS